MVSPTRAVTVVPSLVSVRATDRGGVVVVVVTSVEVEVDVDVEVVEVEGASPHPAHSRRRGSRSPRRERSGP
jgi:hypothetical protein